MKYALQVGWKRQLGPSQGLMSVWYRRTNRIRIQAGIFLSIVKSLVKNDFIFGLALMLCNNRKTSVI